MSLGLFSFKARLLGMAWGGHGDGMGRSWGWHGDEFAQEFQIPESYTIITPVFCAVCRNVLQHAIAMPAVRLLQNSFQKYMMLIFAALTTDWIQPHLLPAMCPDHPALHWKISISNFSLGCVKHTKCKRSILTPSSSFHGMSSGFGPIQVGFPEMIQLTRTHAHDSSATHAHDSNANQQMQH